LEADFHTEASGQNARPSSIGTTNNPGLWPGLFVETTPHFGSADPHGASTSALLQWGASTADGNVKAPQSNIGSGMSPVG
jgi:hypothetical protein